MKNVFFAALAALGIVLGTSTLLTSANAATAPQTWQQQASQAGGEG